jgi:uncharacterized protein (DUF169 family)
MTEVCTEGYAVSVNPASSSEFDREVVAVFKTKFQAESWIMFAYSYKEYWKPNIFHVFWGVEAF